jgi:biopolymer transport protein ExbB/TolQ
MDDLTSSLDGPWANWGARALWLAGDRGARGVLVVLAIMSLCSWYVLFTQLYDQHTLLRAARRLVQSGNDGGSFRESIQRLPLGVLRSIAESGWRAASEYRGRLAERVTPYEWIARSLDRTLQTEQSQLKRGLGVLPTVAVAAPLVGLLGTVYLLMNGLIEYAYITKEFPVAESVEPVPQSRRLDGPVSQEPANAIPMESAKVAPPHASQAEPRAEGEGAALKPQADSTGHDSAAVEGRSPGRESEIAQALQHQRIERAAQLYGILGEELTLLFFGLCVAVPSFVGYRWILGRYRGIDEILRGLAQDTTTRLLAGPLPPESGGPDPGTVANETPAPAV